MRDDGKTKRSFAAINRNLCNYPLARDARLKLHWRRSKRTGRWLCDLSDGERLQLRLPEATPNQLLRWPTAFDVNVLFLLLNEAKKQGINEIEFSSYSSILNELDYSVEARNRRKLKDALALWSALMIWFERWRVPRQYRYIDSKTGRPFDEWRKGTRKVPTNDGMGGEVVRRQLPPPIQSVNADSGRICITVADEWCALGERYFARVPLPLPRDAAAQNLLLCVMTSYFQHGEFGAKQSGVRRVRELCRAIGLDHRSRASKLRNALGNIMDWFKQHGGKLDWIWAGNKIRFVIVKDVELGHTLPVDKMMPVGSAKPESATKTINDNTAAPEDDEAEWKAEFEADMVARGISFDDADDANERYEVWLKRKLQRAKSATAHDDDRRGPLMALTNEGRGPPR